jgi:hypothetical protein
MEALIVEEPVWIAIRVCIGRDWKIYVHTHGVARSLLQIFPDGCGGGGGDSGPVDRRFCCQGRARIRLEHCKL